MIQRGTVFTRHAGPVDADGRCPMSMFGIVEVPIGMAAEEVVHGFATTPGLPRLWVGTGYSANVEEGEYGPTRSDAIDGIIRTASWPRPSGDAGLGGGGFMLRATRAPATDGCEAMILVGAMVVDALAHPDAHLQDLSGGLLTMGTGVSWIETANLRPCPVATNGSTPSQILDMPIWGWAAEPWGLYSTLHLEAQDVCMEICRLRHEHEDGSLDAKGEARLAELERHPAHEIVKYNREEDYVAFRREMVRRMGHVRWDRVRTRAEQDEETRIAMDVISARMRRAA